MDAQRSSGAPLTINIGGADRTFSRLSRRAVCELIASMPADSEQERRWYSEHDLMRWSSTPSGSLAVLSKSSGAPTEEVERWGSIVSQTTAAGVIVAESVLTGEEPERSKASNAEDEYGPDFTGTSRMKPASSVRTRRALATLGRLLPPYGTQRSSASASN